MTRAERRRAERKAKKEKTATYNFTLAELQDHIQRGVEKDAELIQKQAYQDGIRDAFTLMMALSMHVLMTDYWPKTAHKRLPGFANKVVDLYEDWMNDKSSIKDLREDVWKYGGVKLERDVDQEEDE